MPVWVLLIASLSTVLFCLAAPSASAIRRLSVLGSAAVLAVSGFLAAAVVTRGPLGGSELRLDALGAYLALIVSFLSLAASLASGRFMRNEAVSEGLGLKSWRVYYGLLHLFVSSMLLVSIANNLGLLWIAMEATTLSSAFLVGFHRHRHSIEAAWKYVILCSVGIAFALFGTILFYYAALRAGGGNCLCWTAFMEAAPRMDPGIIRLAFLFVAVGYGTKAGLAPLHNWLPDAHSQAPSPVSAMLSGILLSGAFYALARFYSVAAQCLGPAFPGGLLIFFGLCSLAVAAPFILVSRDYKRLLAYSSVEHMGVMALGLGIGTPLAVYGAFLHLLCHALAKALAFIGAGRILHSFGTRKITKVSGIAQTAPETGIPFLAAVLALSGLPPFGIFVSELLILSQGFASGRTWVSLAAVALLAAVFAGLLQHSSQMCFGRGREAHGSSQESGRDPATAGVCRLHTSLESGPQAFWEWAVPAALLLLPLIVLGCWIPKPLNSWLLLIAEIIRGGSHA